MGYETGEAAILTLIQILPDYDSTNTDRQDWKPLESGRAAYYAILRPGAWDSQPSSMTSYMDSWTTVIECWRRYSDDNKPLLLQSDVGTIVAHLRKYPTLNGASGVVRALVAGGENMEEVTLESGSLWARWNINVIWQEENQVTFAE